MVLAMPIAAQESNCPDPVAICAYYHHGSEFTTGCEGSLCFSPSFSDAVAVIATDDMGLLPTVWNLWSGGYLPSEIPGLPCDVRANGNLKNDNKTIHKYKLSIPQDYPLPGCRIEVYQGEYVYHEHFVSNPATGCLGWAECRLYVGMAAGPSELVSSFLDQSDTDDIDDTDDAESQ